MSATSDCDVLSIRLDCHRKRRELVACRPAAFAIDRFTFYRRLDYNSAMPTGKHAADEAMRASLMGWSSLVLVPGMIFLFGLIYAVSPRHVPVSQSWANGTYINACCAPLLLHDGKLTTANSATTYVVSESKFGNQITVAAGISVRNGAVEFGGDYVFVHFSKDSTAMPAIGEPVSLHIVSLADSRDNVFERSK